MLPRNEPKEPLTRVCSLLVCALAGLATPAAAGEWPQWRGTRGDGHADEPNAPLTWSRWVPFQSLMRMLLVGNKERIYAQQAKDLGIVTEVLPPAELMSKAHELAEMIAYNSPRAVRDVKRIMWDSLDQGLDDAFVEARKIMNQFSGHPDSIEGSRALVEKRLPNWVPLE